MQSPLISVTGATGNIGRAVAEQLRHGSGGQPARVRLLVRDLSRAPADADDVAAATYGDRDGAVAALTGTDVLLMVSASESANRLAQHKTFVDAAAEAGVRHVVYTSFLGAAPDATFTLARDHWATEQHLRGSGMAWTFLQDSFYADFLTLLADDEGVIRGPAGDGRVCAVARTDVAACAATVLTDPEGHAGRTYQLTGPETLSLDEAAAIITEVTGRPIRYQRETVDEAYASRRHFGVPDWQLDAWVSTYTAIAAGELSALTDDVQRLTGRRPLSLRELLQAD